MASSPPLSHAAFLAVGFTMWEFVGTGGTSAPLRLFELSFRFRVELGSRDRVGVERFLGRGVADIICVTSGDTEPFREDISSEVEDTCIE